MSHRDDDASSRTDRTERPQRAERDERTDRAHRESCADAVDQPAPAAEPKASQPAAEQTGASDEQQAATGDQQPPQQQQPETGEQPVVVADAADAIARQTLTVVNTGPAPVLDTVATDATGSAAAAPAAVAVQNTAATAATTAVTGAAAAAVVVPEHPLAQSIAAGTPALDTAPAAAAADATGVGTGTGTGTPVAGEPVAVPQQVQPAAQQAGGPQQPQQDAAAARAAAAAPAEGQPSDAGAQQQPGQRSGDQPAADQTQVGNQQQQPTAPVAADASRADRAQQPAGLSAANDKGVVTAPAVAAQPQPVVGRSDVPTRSVRLSQAADAVENAIRIGSARGVTHARMSLNPVELGGVEIRLQQTAQGLSASVVATGAEAAQVLQQAAHELRRSLESQGIDLVRLDISYSGEQREGARSAQAGDGERRSSTGDTSTATDGGELLTNEDITVKSTLELPDGVLVDVLA